MNADSTRLNPAARVKHAYEWLRLHGREGVMRIVRHPYYWVKHYPDRKRFHKDFAPEIAENVQFDRTYGVDTAATASLIALNVPYESWKHGGNYGCINERELVEAIALLGVPYKDVTFIDLGSGKGKALLVASEFPFRSIVGVEFSPDLAEIANTNVEHYLDLTGRRGRDVATVCGDAIQYSFPDGPLFIYLFNPFDNTILSPVIANIAASYQRASRPMWVMYFTPRFKELFDAAPFLTRVSETDRYCVWRSVG